MTVSLIYNTPLWVCAKAIRKCWASEDKSDTILTNSYGYENPKNGVVCGEKDKALINRIGNQNKHSSTLEHLVYSFDIDGISRACLQEVARHRMASYSVKSSRYTLKEVKESDDTSLRKLLVSTGDTFLDETNLDSLRCLRMRLNDGLSNDKAKYMLPEAFKTSYVTTINARSLQNFLQLRTSKSALWEIRNLAYAMFDALPDDHKYLFEDYIYKEA